MELGESATALSEEMAEAMCSRFLALDDWAIPKWMAARVL